MLNGSKITNNQSRNQISSGLLNNSNIHNNMFLSSGQINNQMQNSSIKKPSNHSKERKDKIIIPKNILQNVGKKIDHNIKNKTNEINNSTHDSPIIKSINCHKNNKIQSNKPNVVNNNFQN